MQAPNNYVLPGSIVCPDVSGNLQPRDCCPAVFFAPMSSNGSATPLSMYSNVTRGTAISLFGADSAAAAMADTYFTANPYGKLSVVPFVPTGTAATATVTLTGTATANGPLAVTLNGVPHLYTVALGDTAAVTASGIATLINGLPNSGFTAVSAAGVVTITSLLLGDVGNQGTLDATIDADGQTIANTTFSGGVGAVPYPALLDAMGDCCCFDFLAVLSNDSVSLALVSAEYKQRWGCECFSGGRWYNTLRGVFSDMTTYLSAQKGKNPWGSTVYICPEESAPDYIKLASFIGAAHESTCTDPAATWTGLELPDVPNIDAGGCQDSCLTRQERNVIAYNGGSTTVNGPQGYQIIEADMGLGAINGDDLVDDFLRYPQAAYQTTAFARLFSAWTERFKGLNLASSEISPPKGVEVLTPNMFLAEYKAFLREHEGTLIENVEASLALVQFTTNPNNASRTDVDAWFDPISALRLFSTALHPRINLQGV